MTHYKLPDSINTQCSIL